MDAKFEVSEASTFINLSDEPIDTTEEVACEVHKFVETSKLAGILGWQTTDKLSSEAAIIDRSIKARRQASPAPAARDDNHLNKRVASSGVRVWMENQVALGKTTGEVIEQWKLANPGHSLDVLSELECIAIDIDEVA